MGIFRGTGIPVIPARREIPEAREIPEIREFPGNSRTENSREEKFEVIREGGNGNFPLTIPGQEPLQSPAPDWTHQLGSSRYMLTTGHYQLLGGLPCYLGVPNQFMIVGPEVAHGTVAYKGLIAVHDASISFTVTHWLSCTTAIWP